MINNPHIDKKLASLLLHRKLIIMQQLEEVGLDASLAKEGFLNYIIENEFVNSKDFMIESATLLRLQYIDLTSINIKFIPQNFSMLISVERTFAYLYILERIPFM
ncbi:hypothetical protein fh0823_02790 [Francisella halioticida]|nr:hypothetical protein fh0823_02790 [Francisella halioticida]